MSDEIVTILAIMGMLIVSMLIILSANLAPHIQKLYVEYGWHLCRAKRHRSLGKCWRYMWMQADKCTNCPLAKKWQDIE